MVQVQLTSSKEPTTHKLENLRSLIILTLNKNQITVSIPSELKNLGNLISLCLYNNQQLSGLHTTIIKLDN